MNYSIVSINDDALDGISLFSPFTGIATFDDAAVESGVHPDPSLVYAWIDAGEFLYRRAELVDVVADDAFHVAKGAEACAKALAKALWEKKKLATLTIIQTGGWNGNHVSCFQVGTMVDGEWTHV
jgi:hypothetical protein